MSAWPHPACVEPVRLLRDCVERRTRGSGPGGQHRNKVETKIVLVHGPSGVTAQAGERRHLAQNRSVAIRRLRLALAVEVRGPAGALDRAPSELFRSRVRGGRIVLSPEHDDFPALLAEALDCVGAAGHDPRPAAAVLGCSPTQLVRMLADHPPALAACNAARRDAGLPALRG